MDAHAQPLLLLVQANVDPAHEAAFNGWYYHHVPKLLELPGFRWARRYVNVVGDTKYLALYAIDHVDHLAALYAADVALRDPKAVAEREKFDSLVGLSDVRSNVYEQISGSHLLNPFLRAERPLSAVMMDCVDATREREFNEWYDHSHVPNLTRINGYVSGARFRLLDHPLLVGQCPGPKYLAVYELENVECIPSVADPDHMSEDARAELARFQSFGAPLASHMIWNVFRPVATHHSFTG
ncbi:MAG: hypothetical protein HOI95_26750 [Chromatiales bacterium]|jgi:hypothetical protein|nr:hypothetical protein [Chromatiales bacterium]